MGLFSKSRSTSLTSKPPQFVVLSFDCCRSLEMWDETLLFAEVMATKGINIKFTYFISGVFFLDVKNRHVYLPPHNARGKSLIDFGDNTEDIAERIQKVNRALKAGHEIASHANGHFNGMHWTVADWKQELEMFTHLIFDIHKNNPDIDSQFVLSIDPAQIIGFRAPYLAQNKNLYQALSKLQFKYDASKVSKGKTWPKKDKHGMWEFPLSNIEIDHHGPKQTFSMDHSIYALQSNAKDVAKKGTELWKQYYNEVFDAYMKYFTDHFLTNRVPIFIGHHFPQYNDGVYWEVMKDFAIEVCGKPEVKSTTYKELVDYLDNLTPNSIEKFNKQYFL